MKIINYLELIYKNKIIFAVIAFAVAIFLTSLYYVFKDRIKYLETSSKVSQEYIVSDNLNKNLFHDLLKDAEDLLNYQLEIEDSLDINRYISYNSISEKLMLDLQLLLEEHDGNYFQMDLEPDEELNFIKLNIDFFYEMENTDSINKKNEILKLFFNNIQSKHKEIVQKRLNRYIDKVNYFINNKSKGSNIYKNYIDYLLDSGIENFVEDLEKFTLNENLNTLIIKNIYDDTSSFQKPSTYFIFVLSLIIGVIIAFSFINFRAEKKIIKI